MDQVCQELLQLALLRIVTLSTPFTHSRTIPLCVLNDLTQRYVELLASAAVEAAGQAKRAQPTAWDVLAAFEEFGVPDLYELSNELDEKRAARAPEDIQQLAQSAVKDPVPTNQSVERATRLAYRQATPDELDEMARLSVLSPSPESTPSTPPTPLSMHQEDDTDEAQQDLGDDEQFAGPSNWKDPSKIPSYVPAFLPPFPGEELSNKRMREDSPTAAGAVRDVKAWTAPTSSTDPWTAPIMFSSSMLTAAPPVTKKRSQDVLVPDNKSSLYAYETAADEIARDGQGYLRPSAKRRLVAASGVSPMTLSDSMFGSTPAPTLRGAFLTPGFLPEMATTMIHPFNTNLPYTVAHSVPRNPAPHPTLPAMSQHAHLPLLMSAIAETLATPTSPHKMLFTRLTRMGPPGPLGPKGEALDYEYVGNTSLVASSVEWPQRSYDQRLPSGREYIGQSQNPDASGTPSGSGIKLKLGKSGSTRGGSATPAATPVAETPSASTPFGDVREESRQLQLTNGYHDEPQQNAYGSEDAVMAPPTTVKDEQAEPRLDSSPALQRNTPQPYPAVDSSTA